MNILIWTYYLVLAASGSFGSS